MIRVKFSQVLYVDSIKDYVRIHTENETIVTKDKISVFVEKLPSYFVRIHRSYIINKHKMTSFTSKDVMLSNGMEIPIGGAYRGSVG